VGRRYLVIDTVFTRGLVRPEGVPYTGKAHVIEKLTLDQGGDKIHVALTLDDPVYAKPSKSLASSSACRTARFSGSLRRVRVSLH